MAARLTLPDRALAATGAAFALLVLAGNSLTESVVGTDTSPAGTVRDLAAQSASTAARTGLMLELLGLLCLILFAAAVAAIGVRAGSAWTGVVISAVAAGTMAAVKLASGAPYLVALQLHEELPIETVHALSAINDAAFVLTWAPLALFVLAAAMVLRAAGVVGKALGTGGLVIGGLGLVAALLGTVDHVDAFPVPFLLGVLWVGAAAARVATRRTTFSPTSSSTAGPVVQTPLT